MADEYATAERLFFWVGEANARRWADIDNNMDAVAQDEHIAVHLETASRWIDDALRCKLGETLPFQPGSIPMVIEEITCLQAAWNMYRRRGITDDDPKNNELYEYKRQVSSTVKNIIKRGIILDRPSSVSVQTAPGVYSEDLPKPNYGYSNGTGPNRAGYGFYSG